MSQPAEPLSWLFILFLMWAGGSFGGVLDVLRLVDLPALFDEKKRVPSGRRLFLACLLGGVVGCGGAVSMLFVISSVGKLDTSDSTPNKLTLVSLAVISGFLGYRLLRGVASRLEKDVREVQDLAHQQQKELEQAKSDVNLVDALADGLVIADSPNPLPSDLGPAIEKLEAARKEYPAHRRLVIILARLYVRRGDVGRAVEVLTETLAEKAKQGTGQDKDAADLLYNRSCYFALQLAKEEVPTRKEDLKERAYQDLEQSMRLSPENKADAKADDDLAVLWEEPRFKQLVA